jgi:gliding motility associated protien GldN
LLAFANLANAQDQSFFDEAGNISEELQTNLPTSGPKEGLEPIEMVNPRADDIYWQKVVYRIIDLREKMNFPLYYPELPADNRTSLFALMFRLVQDGKVKVYDYAEEYEHFDDQHMTKFRDLMDKFALPYETKLDSITNDTIYIIDDTDVPNRDIIKYFCKEVWYFDRISSTFNCRIIGFCPVMQREGDTGLETLPLFWIPFETLRPFLSQTEVLITDKNNGARPSFDDLFMKRRFSSYIYKESNVQNRSLLEYNTTLEDVKKEQEMVKTRLINFETDLWEY